MISHYYYNSSTHQNSLCAQGILVAWLTFLTLIRVLPIGGEAATATATTTTCVPSTLRISDKVRHRPQFLTIAHRGASFHLPEHTIPAYRLALELGADFIEPDLVVTKDGRLVAIHSLDLNVTTNVASFFPDRQPWFSPFANKTGYWSFNYTYNEIAQLTVKQRLPDARSTFYDGQFKIPSLEDILESINTWNRNVLPKLHPLSHNESSSSSSTSSSSSVLKRPTMIELAQAGVYAELKDPAWIKQEVGLDIVELMYQHFEQHIDAWSQLLSCYNEMRYDEYVVPGLVIQSFDGDALKNFHDFWLTRLPHPFRHLQQGDNSDSTTAAVTTAAPEPPYVLLVDQVECKTEEFWLKVGDNYRTFIQGIGPAKECLLSSEIFGNNENEKEELAKESFSAIKAREFGLVLHPWTERPEQTFLNSGYDSIWDETLELICRVGVQGIFTESVTTAIAVANFGCNDERAAAKGKGSSSSSDFCSDSSSSSSWMTITAGFVLGLCVSALGIFAYIRLYTNNVGAGTFQSQFSQIEPTTDVETEQDNNPAMSNPPTRGNGSHQRDII